MLLRCRDTKTTTSSPTNHPNQTRQWEKIDRRTVCVYVCKKEVISRNEWRNDGAKPEFISLDQTFIIWIFSLNFYMCVRVCLCAREGLLEGSVVFILYDKWEGCSRCGTFWKFSETQMILSTAARDKQQNKIIPLGNLFLLPLHFTVPTFYLLYS